MTDFLDELIEEYDLPSIDGLALFYSPTTFEYSDGPIRPGEYLNQPRTPEDTEIIDKAKNWARRKFFSVDHKDMYQEIEIKLYVEEMKQGYRFTGPKLMTVCKNAVIDFYRKEARWYEKVDRVARAHPPLDISYQELKTEYYLFRDDDPIPGSSLTWDYEMS